MAEVKGFFAGRGSDYPIDAVRVSRFQEEHILTELHSRRSSVVIGSRQSGKTTLMRKLVEEENRRNRTRAVYVSLETYAGRQDLSEDSFWLDFSVMLFQDTLGVEIPEQVKTRPITTFYHIPAKTHLFIDEFTEVAHRVPSFFHNLRQAIEQGKCPVVVLADRAHPTQYNENSFREVSPFNITGDPFYLQDLTLEESLQLLTKGFKANNLTCDDSVPKDIYAMVSGQPYLTNRLGELCVQLCNEVKKSKVTKENVEAAISLLKSTAFALQDPHFATLHSYLLNPEKDKHHGLNSSSRGKLLDILEGYPVFFQYALETGVLHTYGFIKPQSVTFMQGIAYPRGNCVIRNEVYKTFLQQHKSVLEEALK
ncbi:MAG: AAA family ATPase [Candidatus Woesearchaeota archaeon]|jgi:hypothetical protein